MHVETYETDTINEPIFQLESATVKNIRVDANVDWHASWGERFMLSPDRTARHCLICGRFRSAAMKLVP
jgi:hypothetical protein